MSARVDLLALPRPKSDHAAPFRMRRVGDHVVLTCDDRKLLTTCEYGVVMMSESKEQVVRKRRCFP